MRRVGFAMAFGSALTLALALGLAGGYLLAPALAQAPEGMWNMTEAEYFASFPADVYPESRSRVPIVDRASSKASERQKTNAHFNIPFSNPGQRCSGL